MSKRNKTNKKGILSTILVIQLVLLVIISFTQLQMERESFSLETQYQRVSAYRVASSYIDIENDILYLKNKNSTDETINTYLNFVNNSFKDIYSSDIYVNRTYIKITDKNLEINKEGSI